MTNSYNKFDKISTERIRKNISSKEAGKVGKIKAKNEEGETVYIEPHKVKDEVYNKAKSQESYNQFEKNTLQKGLGIEGTNEALKKRKKIMEGLVDAHTDGYDEAEEKEAA